MTFRRSRDSRSDIDPSTIRAVLFDLDGTLYRQMPLRALMATDIACDALRSWSLPKARRLVGVLGTFRRVREELRALGEPPGLLLDQLQFTRTADRTGVPATEVRDLVNEWVMRRPLRHLRHLVRSGLTPLLDALHARQLRLGVLSDYPAEEKLEVMQLAKRFSFALNTSDPSINAFKPHPKGFWRACEHWGFAPQEVLYVGDRTDIDAVGATAAGMPYFLIIPSFRTGASRLGSGNVFTELRRALAV